MQLTHLQHIDARPSDVAQELVFLVEVATEHLRRLVHSVFDLDGDTTTGLALLDDLRRQSAFASLTKAVKPTSKFLWLISRDVLGMAR